MSIAQIISLVFSLKAQLAVLQNELLSLQNASTSAQVSSTPVGFVPWTPSSTWQQPSSNMPLGAAEPTSMPAETMGSIQLSGNGSTLSDGIEVFPTGEMLGGGTCIVILDQSGNPITDASATITTDSLTNTQQANGRWTAIGSYDVNNQVTQVTDFSTPNFPNCSYIASVNSKGTDTFASAPGYHFLYAPPSDGSHDIIVSALGSTQSVTIESTSSGQ
jgi:hypothetical protein